MSPIQKESWGIVIAFMVALIAFVTLVPLVGLKMSWPVLCLYSVGGFVPVILRRKKNADLVAKDERTKLIVEKATKAAGIAAFEVTILACLIPWGIHQYQGKEQISIVILPFVLFMAAIALWITRAITILVLYGREPKDVRD